MFGVREKNTKSAGKIEKILKKFEELVDEETLKLIALYAMGEVDLNCEVRSVKFYLSPDRAVLNVKLNSCTGEYDTGIDECRVLVKGELLKLLPKLSAGSTVLISGAFAGEVFRANKLEVLSGRSESVSGRVVAVEGKILCISNGDRCLSCYTAFVPKECACREGSFVSIRGVRADKDVFIAESVELEEKKSSLDVFNPFKPVEEAKACTGRVCVEGRVSGIGQVKKFRGKEYASVHVSDESGRVKVMLWSDLDVYRRADIGSSVQIFGCRADGGTLHCDEFTIIRLLQ